MQDRGIGLVPDQNVPMAALPLVAVADGGLKNPVSVQRAGTHPVLGLLAVLLALVLRDRGQHVLDQDRVTILAEFNARAFERAARRRDQFAQLEMRAHVTGDAADIVDDDDRRLPPVLAEPIQHGEDARAVCETPRHVVGEDILDRVALIGRVLAATVFLRSEPVSALRLGLGRHTAVDDRRSAAFGFNMLMCKIHPDSNPRLGLISGPRCSSCSAFDLPPLESVLPQQSRTSSCFPQASCSGWTP